MLENRGQSLREENPCQALAASRLLASMLFEVRASDTATYIDVAALLSVVSLGASYIPARRAMRVDPASAFRQG